jgi:hypothetical protein
MTSKVRHSSVLQGTWRDRPRGALVRRRPTPGGGRWRRGGRGRTARCQRWREASSSDALATAGTGDVLAGLVGAFLARGLAPADAASAAAWIHGRAGERLPPGGTASDLVAALQPLPV